MRRSAERKRRIGRGDWGLRSSLSCLHPTYLSCEAACRRSPGAPRPPRSTSASSSSPTAVVAEIRRHLLLHQTL